VNRRGRLHEAGRRIPYAYIDHRSATTIGIHSLVGPAGGHPPDRTNNTCMTLTGITLRVHQRVNSAGQPLYNLTVALTKPPVSRPDGRSGIQSLGLVPPERANLLAHRPRHDAHSGPALVQQQGVDRSVGRSLARQLSVRRPPLRESVPAGAREAARPPPPPRHSHPGGPRATAGRGSCGRP
jgi:hypothetical protein